MPMDFEVRASRRPLPRQLDVSDWNVDADVRNGNSSVVRSRERDWSTLGTETRASTERWSAQSHAAPRDVTRPTNRYDLQSSESYTCLVNDDMRRTESSRLSRELPHRQEGSNQRTDASQAASTRTPPRSLPSHQLRSLSRPVGVSNSGSDCRGSLYSDEIARYSRDQQREETAVSSSGGDGSERYTNTYGTTYASTSVYETPVRRRLTFDDNQSDATTVIESPAFLRSVMDTPSTIVSSVQSTPQRNSHLDEDSSILSVDESVSRMESTPSESISSISVPSSRIQPTEAGSVSTDEAVSSASVRRVSATEQREQLYAFRRDMRAVFGRIDEMVDLHRDLFRSDPMSGIPDFDQERAIEAERLATDTFRQLSQLRSQFQELTTVWKKSEEAERAQPLRQVLRATTDSLRVTSTRDQHEDDESESNNSTLQDHMARPESPSTDSDDSTTLSSHQELLRRIHTRHRWEPSLSSLSSRSDSIVSRAAPVSPQPPSIVRNEDAPPRPRENVFGDFDRRMEEIRASLNAMARTRHSSTTRSPSETPKEPSYRSSLSSSNENDVNESNHRRPSSRDRDARLRHLLRELGSEDSS